MNGCANIQNKPRYDTFMGTRSLKWVEPPKKDALWDRLTALLRIVNETLAIIVTHSMAEM